MLTPLLSTIAPDSVVKVAPEATVTAPLAPAAVVPELNTSAPLTPAALAFADAMNIGPEELCVD